MSNPEIMNHLYGEYAVELGESLERLDKEFANMIREFPYANIWSREGLTLKERSIATISSLIALGKEDQTEIHMRGFLNCGGTQKELKELIIHAAIYSGFPSSLNAFKAMNKVTQASE